MRYSPVDVVVELPSGYIDIFISRVMRQLTPAFNVKLWRRGAYLCEDGPR